MMVRKILCVWIAMAICASGLRAEDGDAPFVDFSPVTRFIEVDVHALGGGSSVTQNYKGCFSQIRNLNVNMGYSLGVGARAVFGLRNYLGFGTAADIMMNDYNMDLAVVGSDNKSMSAVFVDNHFYTLNIPVFLSFRFNVARSVRLNVDAGFYYAYGLGGKQKQRIYRADINEMDELVPQVENITTAYFHSSYTFVNSYNRGDLGLHLATSLNFGPHLVVGCKFQIGLKNSARKNGVVNPNIHNYNLHGSVGYRF